jgi:leucyl-tRNA synthetase
MPEEAVIATAKATEALQSWIQGRSIVKIIYVPKKILNLVVK